MNQPLSPDLGLSPKRPLLSVVGVAADIPQSWRRALKERNPREQFMWVWFLTSVLVLSLSVGKSDRYILPALTAPVFIASHRLARLVYLLQDGARTAINWPILKRLGELLILREMEPANNPQRVDPKRLLFARLILKQ